MSAMQFEKGCKRSEPSYLCTLRFDEIEKASGRIPGVIKKLLKEFEDVVPDELPRKLPPKRAVDHEIELVPGTKPPARAPYRMSQPELVELRKQLKDMLESGIIKPAKSPYGASVLFQKEGRRLPTHAKYFTKIDLRSSYWKVRIKEGDEAKTTVVIRYGAFEFLVMPFGLTNAPATFSTLMKQVLHGFLDKFVVVYLDDIFIYSRTLAEHVEHLRQETISFLGHIVERGRIRMDPKKVQAIEEWQPPSDVHDLRSFLCLANYYRHFVKSYFEIARSMTDLLKKTETWNWTPQCQESIDRLKRAMVTDPTFALPDMSKPFVVETDASDFALGGVLMQDGHPVAFESRKLKDVERRYSVHEKELLAVVHCLRLWRHYLLGSRGQDGQHCRIRRASYYRKIQQRRAWSTSSSRAKLSILAGRRPSDDQGKPLVCAKGRGPEEVTYFEMPRHSLGGTSGRRTHLCVGAEGLLLATDAGRCRDVCPHLFDLSAGQGRPLEEGWFATTLAHPNETLGKCLHGLHFWIA
ncbi:UNVERIFIED_CONTAM: Transposon Tf2-12 polyprotein [Sesamum latifolium]|uniref:Transposon Tf2-12 polyprotein n=1 Tax=Sesamum latifolium TaxID=2727402 RepID=A0AAW2XBS6_9LAMI